LSSGCSCDCPTGYYWVACEDSDCDRTTKTSCSKEKGFCIKIPSDNKGKVTWDKTSCRFICRSIIPYNPDLPEDFIQWARDQGGEIVSVNNQRSIVLPPCPEGEARVPDNGCICEQVSSGSYWDDPGTPTVPEGYIFTDNSVINIYE
jgi:hypothetical protein